MNLKELKAKISKAYNWDKDFIDKVSNAKTYEELADTLRGIKYFDLINIDWIRECERPDLFFTGKENTGIFNSGYRNSGDRNSGDLNSGDLNSGYRNSGDVNSGDLNSGDRNSGDRNSGDVNSGDLNSGYRNSGDLNSGYRNSGVFCNKKRNDKIFFFNRESPFTWDDWYKHEVYDIVVSLFVLTEWVDWIYMSDEEKGNNRNAYVNNGYLRVYTYKEAWANLWSKLTDDQKELFKTLPNFDADIFRDITGIAI